MFLLYRFSSLIRAHSVKNEYSQILTNLGKICNLWPNERIFYGKCPRERWHGNETNKLTYRSLNNRSYICTTLLQHEQKLSTSNFNQYDFSEIRTRILFKNLDHFIKNSKNIVLHNNQTICLTGKIFCEKDLLSFDILGTSTHTDSPTRKRQEIKRVTVLFV